MAQTRIKICGITRPEDAQTVAECGADAIGLVFYPKSPRAVSLEQAVECVSALPPLVSTVALFVDETADNIQRVLSEVAVDVLQFHGVESPEFCAGFHRPYLKALRVKPTDDPVVAATPYNSARGILLDTWREGVPGGTGETFNWAQARGQFARPLVLAGGLNPDNVGDAIRQVRPGAVDVSGGVESREGVKSAKLIKQFIAAVRSADEE